MALSSSEIGNLAWPRWIGLLLLIGYSFAEGPFERAIAPPLTAKVNLPLMTPGVLSIRRYAVFMLVRLTLDLVVVASIYLILRPSSRGFPLRESKVTWRVLQGLLTGTAVMVAAILTIILIGGAHAELSSQSSRSAFAYGVGWLMFDFIGSAGEELFGRVAVLLIAERFVGRRGAMIVSGLTFSLLHLGNPGATWIWLLRLFVQGMLLAYAVYRTSSVWWSVGYHTGWNWASAPLFGAAGSGYLDQGHIFDFTPTRLKWLTGGQVGPEGSLFAFVAVLIAFCLLILTTPNCIASRIR
jgi:membrane protease YdiL (CAAX protease family)